MFWRNRSGRITPFEHFFGYPPVLPDRHPFGCLVTYLRYDSDKGKLDSRTRRGIYLGPVSEGRRSVHILSLDTGKVVSRSQQDCEFFPTDFPRSSGSCGAEASDDDDLFEFPPLSEGVRREASVQPNLDLKVEPVEHEDQEHKQQPDPSQQQQPVPQSILDPPRRSSRHRSQPVDEYKKFLPTRRGLEEPESQPRSRSSHLPGEYAVNYTVRDDDSPTYRQAMEGSEAEF